MDLLPIDVNIPDVKGMLLVWKPTGPEKKWRRKKISFE